MGWIHFWSLLSSNTHDDGVEVSNIAPDTHSLMTEPLFSPSAYPVHGTHLEYVTQDASQERPVSIVYALPAPDGQNVNGVALLLHACTHDAFKFFSPSPGCRDCVGLSEELEIVRRLLRRGYVALAVTGYDRRGGCWGDPPDGNRIQHALHRFITETHPELFEDGIPPVFAIGASSGGAMAARLLAKDLVDGALVMVMSLSQNLQETLAGLSSKTKKSLYLAPMTRDQGTAKKVRANHAFLTQRHDNALTVVLDETSCRPLPVTADYLWNRVPGMTKDAAAVIVDVLMNEANHLDPATNMLMVDPTTSNWREFVLAKNFDENRRPFMPESLRKAIQNRSNERNDIKKNDPDSLLWNTFDLTPGKSPLAKALHRAWAFHEYCSESVPLALDLFQKGR
jgi:hypothetical protein